MSFSNIPLVFLGRLERRKQARVLCLFRFTSQETCQFVGAFALFFNRHTEGVVMINTTTNIQVLSISQKIIAGSLVLFIGLALIYGTGFVQNTALHNGAHDLRHAIGFPCH